MGRRHNKLGQMCDILETVWSEPGSPVDEQSPNIPPNNITNIKTKKKMDNQKAKHSRMNRIINTKNNPVTNGNTTKAIKTKAFFAALDNMLGQNANMESPEGGPDEFFLLPDRVLAVDSLTFREELAAVAPAFLSPVTPTTPGSTSRVFGGINGHNNNNNGNTSFSHKSSQNSGQNKIMGFRTHTYLTSLVPWTATDQPIQIDRL